MTRLQEEVDRLRQERNDWAAAALEPRAEGAEVTRLQAAEFRIRPGCCAGHKRDPRQTLCSP